MCGANNICNRLDISRPVQPGRSHSEQAAVLHLSAASQASAIEAASDSPAPTLGRPHPSRQTRFALTNPNGRQVVRLRTGDNGCRVRSLRSGAHCGPILRSKSTPPSHSQKNSRSDQVHRRRTCSSENSPIGRPNSTSNTPRLEPRSCSCGRTIVSDNGCRTTEQRGERVC